MNGKPYTLRGVRTVWRGVLGNLLKETKQGVGFLPYYKEALRRSAASVICLHNHPSGVRLQGA
nr:JAB domain-containing protein [uncultured Bacillus sp.]